MASSWLRETTKLYVRYLIAGAASIPAGIAYAYLAMHNGESWVAVFVLIVAGLVLAMIGWRVSERFFRPEQELSVAGANENTVYAAATEVENCFPLAVPFYAAEMAAVIVVLHSTPTKKVFIVQDNLVGSVQVLSESPVLASANA